MAQKLITEAEWFLAKDPLVPGLRWFIPSAVGTLVMLRRNEEQGLLPSEGRESRIQVGAGRRASTVAAGVLEMPTAALLGYGV